jgi:glutathione S-transferase
MELIGTTTSPFVRRVRVVCAEIGVPYTLVDSSKPAGESRLREQSPLWKVPVAAFDDGVLVFDSRAIVDELLRRHGLGPFARTTSARENNLRAVIDGALDSAINVFYLRREGVVVDDIAYCKKQLNRVGSALSWLTDELRGDDFGAGFGLTELALYTALDWMTFRDAYPLADRTALQAFRQAHSTRPSLAATAPHA